MARKIAPLKAGSIEKIEGAVLIRADGRFDRRAVVFKARSEMPRLSWAAAQRYAWRVAREQMAAAHAL